MHWRLTYDSEASRASQSIKSWFASTWRHGWFLSDQRARYDSCCVHSTNLFLFFSASVCLPLLGHAILFSRLSFLVFRLLAFSPSLHHRASWVLCLSARLISAFDTEGSPPQSCGYRRNPAASISRFFPRVRIHLGTRHGRGPVVII